MGLLACLGGGAANVDMDTIASPTKPAYNAINNWVTPVANSRTPTISVDTVTTYGYLCRSAIRNILTHEQLIGFSSAARLVTFKSEQVIYRTGDAVGAHALFYLVEGCIKVSKRVEMYESESMHAPVGADGRTSYMGDNMISTNFMNITAVNGTALINPNNRGTYRPSKLSGFKAQNPNAVSMTARWMADDNAPPDPTCTSEVTLRQIEKDQWFGFCTLLGMRTRQSSMVAIEHTEALVFDEIRLKQFFADFPGTASIIRDQIAGQRVMRTLKTAPFLMNMTEELSALLCTLFQPRAYPANTIVFAEGDAPTEHMNLFVMISGSAVMYQSVPGGGQHVVRVIENGENFGEACCLFLLPRIATVRTNRNSIIMELQMSSLTKFLLYSPDIKVNTRSAYNNAAIATHHLLNNEQIVSYFTKFCETEHSTENIAFWAECKRFRLSAVRNKELLTVDAHRLYQRYIAESAAEQVNLQGLTRSRIGHAIEHGIINKLTFEEAEDEVLHLMDRDSFNRFKNSELFQECLLVCRGRT